ncbi:TonB-dependent receptor [Ferruginibacter sp. SUN002]|uniref:TonB-dependent receptor n=1 Tax=Ferruginibacter sp. SUN002 TaxID=2937789 RepID=UPI003D3640D1
MIKLKCALLIFLLNFGVTSLIFAQDVPQRSSASTDTSIVDEIKDLSTDNIPVVSLDESDGNDANVQNAPVQGNSFRDVFYSAARYNFGAVRFRLRGYNSNLSDTYMNGVPVENLENGFTPYQLWGGLPSVTRYTENLPGLQANKYAFGNVGGVYAIDARASRQRKGTNFGYTVSNRNYVHRFTVNHSTGFNKKGWAFSFAGSRRWADEGYADGTYYDGWSGYVGIDKKVDDQNILSFIALYAPTETGRQGTAVQEAFGITGNEFYNPLWGYQKGKKRNASVTTTKQPVFIVSQDLKINKKTSLQTASSIMFGRRSITGLDWYNAPDPRPDYYRYLPSYNAEDPGLYQQILNQWQTNTNVSQINWHRLYDVNRSQYDSIYNLNNELIGKGKRSRYILEERVTKATTFNFNTTLNSKINKHIDFTAGLTYQYLHNHYFKEVNDLLGGDFYVNVNQFAERTFGTGGTSSINNLNNTNTIVHEGDVFGYNYAMNIHKATAWAQAVFKYKKLNFFLAGSGGISSFYRVGYYKSGLFPDNSFERSTVNEFGNYAGKAGVSYKANYRNYFYVNASYTAQAPNFEDVYLSPRTRDITQSNLTTEKIASIEGGYEYTSPGFKFRTTGYFTEFKDGVEQFSFYNDLSQAFANVSMSNIQRKNMGVEIGTEVIVAKGLSLTGAASIGRYRFSNRPTLIGTNDNSTEVIMNEIVYQENFHTGDPEEVYSAGFNYRSRNYWGFGANFNYFDGMYTRFSPIRRTASAVNGVEYDSKLWHDILDQTKIKAQHTLDLHANWSLKLNRSFIKKTSFLSFSLNVNNILNNKQVVQSSFEQLRFDDEKDPQKFPIKQSYAYGINFGFTVGYRF